MIGKTDYLIALITYRFRLTLHISHGEFTAQVGGEMSYMYM